MKFLYYVIGSTTYIEAVFENTDNKKGIRLEGSGVEVENRNPLVFFDKPYHDIHPDIVGLACLCIFYPFIGDRVTFPFPVTPELADSINRAIFKKHKTITVSNIDDSLAKYEGDTGEVLAFGGGMDSSAVRALFPDAFLVHEASVRNGNVVPDEANRVTHDLEKKGRGSLVKTNSRFISEPGGWHVWTGSIVTALLEAGRRRAKYIYSGTILGSAFMSNGAKYFDRKKSTQWHGDSGNYWQQIFWDIGLPLVQPLMGCSEILTMRASLNYLNPEDIFYCTRVDGKACGSCPKCFRRTCISDYIKGETSDYSKFDNPSVNAVLDKKPLYFGHIYSALLSNGWIPPAFVRNRLEFLPRQKFANHYYVESLDFLPPELRGEVGEVLQKEFSPMSELDVSNMKSWDQDSFQFQP